MAVRMSHIEARGPDLYIPHCPVTGRGLPVERGLNLREAIPFISGRCLEGDTLTPPAAGEISAFVHKGNLSS